MKLEGKELEEYVEKEKLKKEAAKKLEQSKEWVAFLKSNFWATQVKSA